MNIEGKVAVITGGASGLGRATAEMIIANGGKVAILDLNEDLAKATASELGDARAYQVNVTDDESVSNAVNQIAEDFGAIHVNVNCAGIGAASRTVGREGARHCQIQFYYSGEFDWDFLCAQQVRGDHAGERTGRRSAGTRRRHQYRICRGL